MPSRTESLSHRGPRSETTCPATKRPWPENSLAIRCCRGDRTALEELIRTWERPLLYFIRRLVHDEADAWDVLQKTWVQVLSGISAAEQLLPLVYDELRKLAAQKLAQEKPGQTLQATALVHEAYLRLV